MKSLRISIILAGLFFISFEGINAQIYKQLMYDNTVNIYDVVKEAEVYFSAIERNKKGSGWKEYQRWLHSNEKKYFPSGNRSNIDHFIAINKFDELKRNERKSDRNLYPNGWKSLGPATIDSITGHYAVGLGRVEDFYVNPANENLVYAASRSGGFWKSTNGGVTFTGGTTDLLPASGINTLTVSPTNPDHILINVRNADNGYSHGIYKSTDGGNTWVATNFIPSNIGYGGLGSDFTIYEIAYHPTIANLVFIGTNKGLYRSTNNLQTWTLSITSSDISEFAFHPTNANIVYIYDQSTSTGNINYILKSTDGGLNFSQTAILNNNNGNASINITTTPACPNCFYAASNNGMWKSTNEGSSFIYYANPAASSDGFSVSNTDTTKMIIGNIDVYRSINGGTSWMQTTEWSLGNTNGSGNGNQNSYNTSTNYVHADIRNGRCINGKFYVCTDGFIGKSNDNGINWTKLVTGLDIRENYCIGLSQSNHGRTYCGSQDNGLSLKLEDTWLEVYGADGMEGFIHPLNDDWFIGSIQYGSRRKSIDAGQTTTGANPPGAASGYWVAPLINDPLGSYGFL